MRSSSKSSCCCCLQPAMTPEFGTVWFLMAVRVRYSSPESVPRTQVLNCHQMLRLTKYTLIFCPRNDKFYDFARIGGTLPTWRPPGGRGLARCCVQGTLRNLCNDDFLSQCNSPTSNCVRVCVCVCLYARWRLTGDHAECQVCCGGRWRCGEDLPAHLLHHRSFSQRIHPHSLRQLQQPGARPRGRFLHRSTLNPRSGPDMYLKLGDKKY